MSFNGGHTVPGFGGPKVFDGFDKVTFGVTKVSDADVAAPTKESAKFPGLMIVVDDERRVPAADPALSVLGLDTGFVLVLGDAVFCQPGTGFPRGAVLTCTSVVVEIEIVLSDSTTDAALFESLFDKASLALSIGVQRRMPPAPVTGLDFQTQALSLLVGPALGTGVTAVGVVTGPALFHDA